MIVYLTRCVHCGKRVERTNPILNASCFACKRSLNKEYSKKWNQKNSKKRKK